MNSIPSVNEPSFSGDFSLAAGFLRHFFLKKVADKNKNER
jgi:hypothetical protein